MSQVYLINGVIKQVFNVVIKKVSTLLVINIWYAICASFAFKASK